MNGSQIRFPSNIIQYALRYRLLWVLLLFVALPILALITFGVLLEVGVFPDSKAVRGEKVEDRLRPFLEEHGLLGNLAPGHAR